MEFKEYFSQFERLEGKPYTEVLENSSNITNFTARIKSEGIEVYSMHTLFDKLNEHLYSFTKNDKGKLQVMSRITNPIHDSKYRNLTCMDKLERIYKAVQTDGVLTDNEESISYAIWSNGGLAVSYLDPATSEVRYFYDKEGRIRKELHDKRMVEYSYQDDGTRTEVISYFIKDESSNLKDPALKLNRQISETFFNSDDRRKISIERTKDFERVIEDKYDKDTDTSTTEIKVFSNKFTSNMRSLTAKQTRTYKRVEGAHKDGDKYTMSFVTKQRDMDLEESQYFIGHFRVDVTDRTVTSGEHGDTCVERRAVYDKLSYKQALYFIENEELPEQSSGESDDTVEVYTEANVIESYVHITSTLTDESELLKLSVKTTPIAPVGSDTMYFDVDFKYNHNVMVYMSCALIKGSDICDCVLSIVVNGYDNIPDFCDIMNFIHTSLSGYSEISTNYLSEQIYSLSQAFKDGIDLIDISIDVIEDNEKSHVKFHDFINSESAAITCISVVDKLSETARLNTQLAFNDFADHKHTVNTQIDTEDLFMEFTTTCENDKVTRFDLLPKEAKEKIETWEAQMLQLVIPPMKMSSSGENTPVKITHTQK